MRPLRNSHGMKHEHGIGILREHAKPMPMPMLNPTSTNPAMLMGIPCMVSDSVFSSFLTLSPSGSLLNLELT